MANKKHMRRRLKGLRNYNLPKDIIKGIREQNGVHTILKTIESVKQQWSFLDGNDKNACWKSLLERNILTCAAWYGHTAMVDYVLSKWMSQQKVNKRGLDVWTGSIKGVLSLPMCVAAYRGNVQLVHLLLRHVGTITKKMSTSKIISLPYWSQDGENEVNQHEVSKISNYETVSAIDMLLIMDRIEILEAISSHPCIEWERWLFRGIIFGALKCVKYIITRPEIDSKLKKIKFSFSGHNAYTPLMFAVQSGFEMSKLLFEAGVDANTTDDYSRNALHFAVAPNYLHLDQLREENSGYIREKSDKNEIIIVNKELNQVSTGMKKYRLVDEDTLKTVDFLVGHGIDRTVTGYCDAWNSKSDRQDYFPNYYLYSAARLSSVNKNDGLRPLSVLINQLQCRVQLMVDSRSENIPSREDILPFCNLLRNLICKLVDRNALFSFGEEQFPVFTWYHITINCINRIQTQYLEHLLGRTCNEEHVKGVEYGHRVMHIALRLSNECMQELYNSGYTQLVCPYTDFGYSWLFTYCIKALSERACEKNSLTHRWDFEQNHPGMDVCPIAESLEAMTQKMTLGYRYFVRKTLEAQFVHGTSMGEYQAEFEDISRIAHRRISAEFLPEVLSLLCALPHQQFYSAVAVLENNPERKPYDDDSEWEELQAMEEESGLNLIKLPCLRTSICEMDLGSNPRSLSHICRIVIYSAMGNRLSAVEDFLPHNMKEYLHTFCYY